jgi:DNA-binding response OmpR family regulator
VQLDLHRRRAVTAHASVSLGEREFAMLAHVMWRSNSVCSREELLHDLWDMDFDPVSNVIEVCLRRLRMKLQLNLPIERVRGGGYCSYDD